MFNSLVSAPTASLQPITFLIFTAEPLAVEIFRTHLTRQCLHRRRAVAPNISIDGLGKVMSKNPSQQVSCASPAASILKELSMNTQFKQLATGSWRSVPCAHRIAKTILSLERRKGTTHFRKMRKRSDLGIVESRRPIFSATRGAQLLDGY